MEASGREDFVRRNQRRSHQNLSAASQDGSIARGEGSTTLSSILIPGLFDQRCSVGMFPRTCLPLFDLHHSVHPTTMKAWAQRTINDRFRAYRKLIQNIPVYLLYSLFRSGP